MGEIIGPLPFLGKNMIKSILGVMMVNYLMQFVGTPYLWAGNNPIEGFDCSGLINEGLRSEGILGPHEDLTSQGIFDRLKNGYKAFSPDIYRIQKNDLLFFGSSPVSITHVAIAYDDRIMLEAGGGDSSCDSIEKAKEMGAFVRLRPISMRKDIVATVRL